MMWKLLKARRVLLMVTLSVGLLWAGLVAAKPGNKPPKDDPPPPQPTFSYSYTPLGTLGGATSWANDINTNGDVVGGSTTGSGTIDHGFVYTAGSGIVDLNDLIDPATGILLREAEAINDGGQVIGFGHLFDGDGNLLETFLYRLTPDPSGAGFATVDNLGDFNTFRGTAINNDGDVGGFEFVAGVAHAALYTEATGWVDLGTLAGDETQAWGITNSDANGDVQLAGYANTADGDRAWRYDTATGVMEDLGTFFQHNRFSSESQGCDINEAGQVAGWTTVSKNDDFAARHTPGVGWESLGTLSDDDSWGDSKANGLNNFGDTVGTSLFNTVPDERAFLYMDEFGILNLEDLIDNLPAGLEGQIPPADINDSGEICGPWVTNFTAYTGEAYILTLVP